MNKIKKSSTKRKTIKPFKSYLRDIIEFFIAFSLSLGIILLIHSSTRILGIILVISSISITFIITRIKKVNNWLELSLYKNIRKTVIGTVEAMIGIHLFAIALIGGCFYVGRGLGWLMRFIFNTNGGGNIAVVLTLFGFAVGTLGSLYILKLIYDYYIKNIRYKIIKDVKKELPSNKK